MLTPLFALVLSVVPACDGEDYADLGVSAEELDRMSEEELDALAEEDDLRAPLPPPTHGVDSTDTLGKLPHFTHGVGDHGVPNDDRPETLPTVTNGPRPTHGEDLGDIRVSPEPEGCDTHGDEPTFAAR